MPGDFQTYFPKVYGFRPHMRHIRTSGMADSELFQRHSDQLLDRSRGRFAQNAPQNLLGRGAGEAQHGQRRKGLVKAPARPGLVPPSSAPGAMSLPLNSTMIFCAVLRPSPLTFFSSTALPP